MSFGNVQFVDYCLKDMEPEWLTKLALVTEDHFWTEAERKMARKQARKKAKEEEAKV